MLAVLAVATVPGSGAAQAAPEPTSTDLYLVQLADAPVASYDGGVAGLAATKPARGGKVDLNSSSARAYRGHLAAKKGDVRRKGGVGAAQTVRDYDVAFNGFAADLTEAQAGKLRHTAGVLNVWKNETRQADTVGTPRMLGLEGRKGVWEKQFKGDERAGEGVIVGVIDSGIWPDNPSFAALPEPRPDAATIAGKWRGACDAGVTATVSCNNKLIGARWYNASGLGNRFPGEFQSPRDYNGHGSHTASTSAGNHGVAATINGLSVGEVSGMAPAARIAAYKALWHQPGGGASGGTVDLVAAINDAVADGVDVINYSVSGSQTSFVDPVELAFLSAADAGVFVAASAGNTGPGASTVAHNSPWITTVAASTHDRSSTKTAALGNGASYTGVGVGGAVAATGLVDATAAGKAGVPVADAELCLLNSLDPARVTGKIVLCKRGVNARTEKSLTVRDAGGVGMIQYNDPDNSLNGDFHFVPSVHVDRAAGLAIKAYAATAGATASLSASVAVTARAPEMAAFSSAGPARAGNGNLLKPDITAPGVDVVAAVAPPGNNNRWDALSGTSMSSPHIAGLAALLIGKNPSWSPIWVKSALMTTAGQKDNSGAPIQRAGRDANPLDFGAGHVQPAASFKPGLVYDSGYADWVRFLCGTGQVTGQACATYGTVDPSDLNYPSISVGALPGKQTVTRTVTNIAKEDGDYTAKVEVPAGYTVAVSPSRIKVKKGRSATFTVTITRTSAALGQWSFGSLTWVPQDRDEFTDVRSPIAVRATAISAPTSVTGTGSAGTAAVKLRPGFTGTLTADVSGAVPANVTALDLVGTNTSFNSAAPATGPAVGRVDVTVPTGSKLVRFATFDADYAAGMDVDLFAYDSAGRLVGSSAGGTAEESITLTAAGTYSVYVVQFALPAGRTQATVKHHDWVLGPASGNLTATPASQSATTGVDATVTLGWTGLTAGARYLGLVALGDGTGEIARTVVSLRP
ncbi:hypothetical protein GCM10010429_44240 [Micromonospora olivasterospora]